MKIDFERLDRMAAAGAPAAAIIEALRVDFERDEARKVVKRPKDATRIRAKRKATRGDKPATPSDTERQAATLSDTPRARLFREGKPALLSLGVPASSCGGLIGQWLKLTNDDDQLVLATILRAQALAVADAPSWILATLKGKTNGDGTGPNRANSATGETGSTAILAGVAAAAERRARERGGAVRPVPAAAEPAHRTDPELFGAGDG